MASLIGRDIPRLVGTRIFWPVVGKGDLHTPSGYQPHPMHVWPSSTRFRKIRLNVEIQKDGSCSHQRANHPSYDRHLSSPVSSHCKPRSAITRHNWITAYSPVSEGNHGLKNLKATGWGYSRASIVGVEGKPSNAWSSLAKSQRPAN